MNPDRLVARLATVMALNNFSQGPFPTVAGNLIFDSRIEPVEDFKQDVVFPVCVVYTDYDRDHWNHHTLVGKDRLLTVTFELLIAQVSEAPEPGTYMIGSPNTDSELETSLDIFEMQIAHALQADNVAADCWRHIMYTPVNTISRRGATVEGGAKLAARQVTVESKVPRGPANGTIAPTVEAFLSRLEQHADFTDRVPAIRQLYTRGSSASASAQLMAASGWSDRVATALGHSRIPSGLLPQTIQWLDSTGAPL